jgi:hypothetical protein
LTDVDKTQLAISRGARAQALLKDDLLNEAFDTLKSGLVKAMLASDPRDREGRELAYLAANQIDKLKDILTKVVSDGKVAQRDIERLTQ